MGTIASIASISAISADSTDNTAGISICLEVVQTCYGVRLQSLCLVKSSRLLLSGCGAELLPQELHQVRLELPLQEFNKYSARSNITRSDKDVSPNPIPLPVVLKYVQSNGG